MADSDVLVTMVRSVDEHVAGETYRLPAEKADSFILKGYADGDLSRVYGDVEVAELTANSQTVGV